MQRQVEDSSFLYKSHILHTRKHPRNRTNWQICSIFNMSSRISICFISTLRPPLSPFSSAFISTETCVCVGVGVGWTAEHLPNVQSTQHYNRWHVNATALSFIHLSKEAGQTVKHGYQSKMSETWPLFHKSFLDSEQLSNSDYVIKYWTYSVWLLQHGQKLVI